MKRQIVISLLVVLSSTGFASAIDLPGFGINDITQDGPVSYKEGELIVRFADMTQAHLGKYCKFQSRADRLHLRNPLRTTQLIN